MYLMSLPFSQHIQNAKKGRRAQADGPDTARGSSPAPEEEMMAPSEPTTGRESVSAFLSEFSLK